MTCAVNTSSNIYVEKLNDAFGIKGCFTEFNPGKYVLNSLHQDISQKILDAKVRKDDIWFLSFPRSGSTWCGELIWLICNDMNFTKAKEISQEIRIPLIEASSSLSSFYENYLEYKLGNSVDFINNLPSPRIVKSHLPYELLPRDLHKINPKIIYMARNPKDICVSLYYFFKLMNEFSASFEEFCEMFLNDGTPYSPFINNYLTFWNKRYEENIFFIKYEDMAKDLRGTLCRIAKFLGKNFSEKELDALCEFTSFSNMRNNTGCNMKELVESKMGKDRFQKTGIHFIRKGEVGDHKNHMTPEMSRRFDEWLEKRTKGTGLTFD